jgi:hypothetical protein
MLGTNEREHMVKHEMRTTELCRSVRFFALIVGMVFASSSTARAQYSSGRSPQLELAGTYSFIRANAANSGGGFNLNGGSVSLAYTVRDRFSAIADVGAYRFGGLPLGLNSTMYTYLFGPRIMLSKSSRTMPFAQILLGGGRLNASSSGIAAGENAFAFAIGGGLDVPFRSHITVRVVQADYLMTRFASVNGSSAIQNNYRISAGVVIRFGGR